MNEYPAHLLCYGKGADPVFSSVSTPQRPGTAFACRDQSDRDILVAGGFPGAHPDSLFPLSPTLQLNADLGSFNDAALHQIASAELFRHTGTQFRSYTLAPDPRVVVLAGKQDKLFAFIDTYGGVLDLQPLLLQGYHPELTTAGNPEIDCSEKKCKINYQVKTPILTERCTYCGACGPACPEDCLSEQLFLDFSRCTLCKECVTACPNDALDLHGVEQRKVTAPALLVLDDVAIDLPQNKKRFYRENELAQLFASIGEYQVDEVVSCNNSICQYLGPHRTGCTRCAMVCPEQAVTLTEDGVQIDQQRCTECGNCICGCPTGALQYLRFSDQQFLKYWSRLDVLPSTETVVIGNEAQLHRFWWKTVTDGFPSTFFLEYPNPRALTSMHFLAMYGTGVRRILLLTGAQEGKEAAFMEQISQANQIFASLEGDVETILITDPDNLPALLAQPVERQSTRSTVIKDHGNRRATLAALLVALMENRTPSPSRLEDELFSTFGTILCDEDKCTQCLACLSCCNLDSLQANEEHFALMSNPSYCVQCGSCIALCPENALSTRNGLELNDDFFKSHELSRAEPARCAGCGKIFGTRKSLERVQRLLAEKSPENYDSELLAYCDTCRVVRIFEGQQFNDTCNPGKS
ncbi:MAG: 4Fe-4S dicluster domain-containing protein [Desulfobulbaceae bacterium]|nr:4Fe-4S dicluster domain-containing protein [Desulfobulbaceae bacterium]